MTVDRGFAAGPPLLRGRSGPRTDSLADVLERVLDKGVVIVGDVVVSVLDVELLTLKLRLFIASADTAREMGLDWWTTDPFYCRDARASRREESREEREESREEEELPAAAMQALRAENEELRSRLAMLESSEPGRVQRDDAPMVGRREGAPGGRWGEPASAEIGRPFWAVDAEGRSGHGSV